jgi:hypothetical protein
LLVLVGCSQPEYREADEQVLCHPKTHHAYHVKPGAGDTSFVRRNPSLDALCKP